MKKQNISRVNKFLYLNHFPRFRKPYFENISKSKYNICIPIPKMHLKLRRQLNNSNISENRNSDDYKSKRGIFNDYFELQNLMNELNVSSELDCNKGMKKQLHTSSKSELHNQAQKNGNVEDKKFYNDVFQNPSVVKINSERKRNLKNSVDNNTKIGNLTSIKIEGSNSEINKMKLLEAISNVI